MDFQDPPVDFVAVARGLGLAAIRINDPADLGQSLSSAIDGRKPTLIEVMIEGTVSRTNRCRRRRPNPCAGGAHSSSLAPNGQPRLRGRRGPLRPTIVHHHHHGVREEARADQDRGSYGMIDLVAVDHPGRS